MDLLTQGNGGSQSSINMASCGGGGRSPSSGGRGGGSGRGRNQSGGRGRGNGGRDRGSNKPRFNGRCQVCSKEGHNTVNCWHRFDADYVSDDKNVNTAVHRYSTDNSWYTDTGATDHITSELDKLVIHDKYTSGDKIRTASGAGMNINHIGQAIVSTPGCDMKLNNVLHVPYAKKNLVSVHRLATDNHAFLEFHPDFFLIKDQGTKKTLLEGKCKGGLYPLPKSRLEAFSAVKPSTARCHSRLGHPALPIVNQVISKNNLPCVREDRLDTICDACQQAKSHQLPYPKSSSLSESPLDLLFSDVWGPTPDSFGRNKYYVSFIDDHSKFVWIYLLRHKSEVFEKFHEFQQLVERRFNRKIVTIQTDGGNMSDSIPSLERLASLIWCHVLMLTNKTVLPSASIDTLLRLVYLF
jgi:hypothetical protein